VRCWNWKKGSAHFFDMRLRLLIVVSLLFASVAYGAMPGVRAQKSAEPTLAIIGVTVIDVRVTDSLSARRGGQTVIVDRGTITHIGRSASSRTKSARWPTAIPWMYPQYFTHSRGCVERPLSIAERAGCVVGDG
jgi:hypothetical protein